LVGDVSEIFERNGLLLRGVLADFTNVGSGRRHIETNSIEGEEREREERGKVSL